MGCSAVRHSVAWCLATPFCGSARRDQACGRDYISMRYPPELCGQSGSQDRSAHQAVKCRKYDQTTTKKPRRCTIRSSQLPAQNGVNGRGNGKGWEWNKITHTTGRFWSSFWPFRVPFLAPCGTALNHQSQALWLSRAQLTSCRVRVIKWRQLFDKS